MKMNRNAGRCAFHFAASAFAPRGVTLCLAIGSTLIASAADAPSKPKETLPAGVEITAVEILPASIELTNQYEYAQVLLTGKLASGEQIDLTRMASTAGTGDVVSIWPTGVV